MISSVDVIVLLIAFVCIWFGSGLIISSVEKLAGSLNVESFVVSFFVLGFLTSLTEISVGLNALIDNTPEISAGNLLGGSVILLFFAIPLLGLISNKINLDHNIGTRGVLYSVLSLLSPFFLILDKNFSVFDGYVVLFFYSMLIIYLYSKDLKEYKSQKNTKSNINKLKPLFSVILGVTVLILSSNYLVDRVALIADNLGISPFVISLLIISLGTNIPEIVIAIRSILDGDIQIAFGNYLGSSVFNIFILGLVGIISNGFDINSYSFITTFIVAIGFSLFYVFIKSKNSLSRKECLILFLFYFIFLLSELLIIKV